MNLGLAPILFILVVSMTAVKSQILKGPVNALKKVGDSVTLECVTVKKNCDQVEWQKVEGLQSPKLVYRNGQGMLNTDSYPTQRYSVNGNGGCSLTITQLVIGDSGRFLCMQAVESGEETRTSILIVINVTESCLSNVTSNAFDKGDGYSLRCSINIPPKSVEPWNVTLSFHDKTVGETETTDDKQPLTVNTTLTGTAKKETATERVCRASFPPSTQANYDKTVAFLDVCTTQQFIVSYPVENIAVFPPGPYREGFLVLLCAADGHPPPTFKWTRLKSLSAVVGATLLITGDAGAKYTCTATNTVKGSETSKRITIEVSPHTTTHTTTPTSTPTSASTPTPPIPPPFQIPPYSFEIVLYVILAIILCFVVFAVVACLKYLLHNWHIIEMTIGRNGERANDPSTDVSIGEPKRTSTSFTFGEPEKGTIGTIVSEKQ